MKTNRKRIFFFILFLAIAGGAYYVNLHKEEFLKSKKTPTQDSQKYVNFGMELFDKISTIYWNKSTPADLSQLFKMSLEKATASSTTLITSDRDGTEKMLKEAFSISTTSDAKKQMAINLAVVALYNIAPAGRNQIFSQKQEKQFRDTVANVNPTSDLYGDLGVGKTASKEEIEKTYKEKQLALKNATSSEDKAKLAKAEHAYSVLANTDNKNLYDEAKIEPTLKFKRIGTTFYADLSQIAPTTLFELVKAIDNASTTKMDTLIVDFRGNIGGSLDFLPAFFGLFVGKDQYVFDLFHQGEYKPERTTQPKYPVFSMFKEIAILTDSMTQSTAELTSATFKKFHMAKVVGTKTRGWGTIENTYPMDSTLEEDEKYVLLLVNSITLRDDGEPIEGRGVDPDLDTSKSGWQKDLPKYFKSQSLIDAIKTVIK